MQVVTGEEDADRDGGDRGHDRRHGNDSNRRDNEVGFGLRLIVELNVFVVLNWILCGIEIWGVIDRFCRKRVVRGVRRSGRLRVRGFLVNDSRLDLWIIFSHCYTTLKSLYCSFLPMRFRHFASLDSHFSWVINRKQRKYTLEFM